MSKLIDYYKVLGVQPDANGEQIGNAYREAAKKSHPDHGGSHENMVLLNKAWKVLSDPKRRADFDRIRAQLVAAQLQKVRTAETKESQQEQRGESPSAKAFDPYYEWLGIPPKDQPSNHYRLLGIELFESNLKVIRTAANRQMAHLRTFHRGEHAKASENLLNEVAVAMVCLVDPEAKAAYDELLRKEMSFAEPSVEEEPRPNVEEPGFADIFREEGPGAHTSRSRLKIKRRQRDNIGWLAGIAAVVAVVLGLVMWSLTASRNPPQTARAGRDASVSASVSTRDGTKTVTPPDAKTATARKEQGKALSPPHPSGKVVKPPAQASDVHDSNAVENQTKPAGPQEEPGSQAEPVPEAASESKAEPKPELTPAPKADDEQPKRQPVPSTALQQATASQVEEVYKLADARKPEEQIKRAKDLANMAQEATKPEEQFVLLRKAAELAGDAGDTALMFQMVNRLGERFELDALNVKAKLLAKLAAKANDAERIKSLVEGSDALIDQAVAEDRFDLALDWVNAVSRLCQKREGAPFRKQVLLRRKAIQTSQQEAKKVGQALEAARANPQDAEANLTVGKLYCFTKGDWAKGLSYLAKGSDENLKMLALQESNSPPSDTEGEVKLADAWWNIAQAVKGKVRGAILLHAGMWYQRAQVTLPVGLVKARVAKRLEEIAALGREVQTVSGTFRGQLPHSWLIIFRSSDPSFWNTSTKSPSGFAVPLSTVPDDIAYLRLKADGKQPVIIAITKDRLGKQTDDGTWGWEGTNFFHWNAHHLGIYSKMWTNDPKVGNVSVVAIPGVITYGGWGFGHVVLKDDRQGYGWKSEPIPSSVYEIAVKSGILTKTDESCLLK